MRIRQTAWTILIFDQISGQEEYDEHHSEITQCRFSNSGATIASSDVDGVVKVSMDFIKQANTKRELCYVLFF